MTSGNIVLTGMPGSGKSTVGVILAKELCRDFVDTDILIQRGEGMTLQEIIDTRGMEHFRALEERYITQLDITEGVIAPGGSAVLSERAMSALTATGVVVFLDTPVEKIRKRIDIYTRGIVATPGMTFDDVWRNREPLYRRYADIVIDCDGLNQLEIVQAVVPALEGYTGRGA